MLDIKGTKYYTLQEIAQALSVSTQAVSRWRREGKLTGYQMSERKFMFSEDELEKLVRGEKND